MMTHAVKTYVKDNTNIVNIYCEKLISIF